MTASIYDKPVRILFEDMVKDLGISGRDVLTRDKVYAWFKEHYPKIKRSTVSAHLIKMSINANSRVHYNAGPADDLLFQIDSQQFRRYEPTDDPQPIYNRPTPLPEMQDEEDGDGVSREFAYERDLQSFLAKNLHLIEQGLHLYYDDDGASGIEFPVDNRRVDILAVDQAQNYVVIELKVSRGYDRTVGQLLRYMAWIRQNHAEPEQDVRGIIIAREISDDLRLACSEVGKVSLYEYALSVALKPVKT